MEVLIIIFGIILDRITKLWALKELSSGHEIEIIKNFFSFNYLENRGAAFGIFQGKTVLLVLVTLLIMIGVIYYFIKYRPTSRFMRIGVSFIVSGALGNLYDRIFYKYVVDFILIHYKNVYYYPTFNIADILVVVGTIMLAIFLLREGK
ncbi:MULTISPECIES: signal peptidase II [Clostridium]|uniref:Lipoprotein signal peptidase n=1 Tax=Clostridium novyi (strain NT) TaxID=386415 RepID=LSPA_CLONN|nr:MULTISPECIES: signal peptidase II [Clostridium]A0Q072.1 RecName: Full=Lipoprotein signal peptidase; AltName: Full=Prolipoprotein signal peptidase; AltName: Full=Signal peptidase II; Short=SPase II [Clostridium novyi NT]ABK62109.1 lipoprotein signal peptidase [Clostridium novyi NT]KEH85493.1 signal peptidase [Clostridium novyi A str. NCTC 538]KEH86542.1 signal peptidase [Clostridium novyi A str. BKT29909]KEH87901.1 signal peptidase [Clostridium novyi A str. 4540]KEH93430.1 signal peptidase 